MKWYSAFLMMTWEIIQTVIGGVVFLVVQAVQRIRKRPPVIIRYREAILTITGLTWGGITLGRFIFLSRACHDLEATRHEYGHAVQSMITGPLYLLIGLVSLAWAAIFTVFRRRFRQQDYFQFWTEAWADVLGSVNTNLR